MQIFLAWFCALYVERLKAQEIGDIFLRAFPGIREMTRDQQKREALAVLHKYKSDANLLSHPDTEPHILPDDDSE
jgi:hypothetical protein